MKNSLLFLILTATLLLSSWVMAQENTDGFASVSGDGLETTTGGEGGEVVIADTYSTFNTYATSSKPYIILIKGTIEPSSWQQVNVNSNKTIVGYGTEATLKNMELHIIGKQNIIIRNLIIRDSNVPSDTDGKTYDYDAIQADYSHHIWIDHCFFTNCNDGLIDLRHGTDYVTVSYTKLSHHNKTFGIGWISDADEHDFHVTIHHCWHDSTTQRNPSFDVGIGHLYNNYLHAITSYGNLARGMGRVIVQNSYFENVKNPVHAQDSAYLYSSNNLFYSCNGNMTGNIDSMMYDPADYYDYTLDPVDSVKKIVIEQAGPQQAISDLYYARDTTAITNLRVSPNNRTIRYSVDQQNRTLKLSSETTTDVQVKIYSFTGQLLLSGRLDMTSYSDISLDRLKQGIYILYLKTSTKVETGKFMIRH